MMKLLCTIGSQGLSDGRTVQRGDEYEVDEVVASTLVTAGYATVVVEAAVVPPVVVEKADVVEQAVEAAAEAVEVVSPAEPHVEAVAEAVEAVEPIPEPEKTKRTYKRRT